MNPLLFGSVEESDTEEPFRVPVGDPLLVLWTHGQSVEEGPRLNHRSVGVICGEHYPVHPDFEQQVQEGGQKVEPTECIVDVPSQVIARFVIQFR